MASRRLPGVGLRTTWAEAPEVAVIMHPNRGGFGLKLTFDGAPLDEQRCRTITEVTFSGVIEYRWITDKQFYLDTNPDDFEFALIEILDSQLKERLLTSGPYRGFGPGERLGGILEETRVRHFRIGFDEHGAYDVLCTDIALKVTQGVPEEP